MKNLEISKYTKLSMTCVTGQIFALFLFFGYSADARKKKAAPPVPLTEVGERHLKEYTAKLEALKQEIIKMLPKLEQNKLEAYVWRRSIPKYRRVRCHQVWS